MKISSKYLIVFSALLILLINPKILKAEEAVAADQNSNQEAKHEEINFTGKNFESLPWKGTIMFSKESVDQLYAVLSGSSDIFRSLASQPTTTSAGNVTIQTSQQKTYPTFYLGSVGYYSNKNWAVWLSSKRIRNDEKVPSLKILKIHERNIDVAWQDIGLQTVAPDWQSRFVGVDGTTPAPQIELNDKEKEEEIAKKKAAFEAGDFNWDYKIKDLPVYLDSATHTLRFTLNIRQTFDSYTLSIVEGYKAPFTPVQEVTVASTNSGAVVLPDIISNNLPNAAATSTLPPVPDIYNNSNAASPTNNQSAAPDVKDPKAPASGAPLPNYPPQPAVPAPN